MIRVITDYLDESVKRVPDKIAFADERRSLTFAELQREAFHIAQCLIQENIRKSSVAIYLDKSVECIACFMGIAYSGNFYTMLDTEMPLERTAKILDVLGPQMIITDHSHSRHLRELRETYGIKEYAEAQKEAIDIDLIRERVRQTLSSDPLQVMFTSGSTGIPKGVVSTHQGIIYVTESATKAFGYGEKDVFANQFPFYFIGSATDIYATIKNGATDYIIPSKFFYSPQKIVEFLSEKAVTSLVWSPSAFSLLADYDALEKLDICKIRNVIFGGEVMPVKTLNQWKQTFPEASFVNLYGATEFTGPSLYYVVNRSFSETETLPLGNPIENTEVLILAENGKEAEKGQIGELCIRSAGLAKGYYKDEIHTQEVFIQNPLHTCYPDIIYRTHDLVFRDIQGEIRYVGRKDFQIKRRGYRIELGEIEVNVASLREVRECCCIYKRDEQKIVLFYCGGLTEHELLKKMRALLPAYMMPDRIVKADNLPRNRNGKLDRIKLGDWGLKEN